MRQKAVFLFALTILLSSSCKQSSNVVGEGFIQKRKYRKGFFTNIQLKRSQVDLRSDAFYPDASKAKRDSEEIPSDNKANQSRMNLTRMASKPIEGVEDSQLASREDLRFRRLPTSGYQISLTEKEPNELSEPLAQKKKRLNHAILAFGLISFLLVFSALLGPPLFLLAQVLFIPWLVSMGIAFIYWLDHFKSKRGKEILHREHFDRIAKYARRAGFFSLAILGLSIPVAAIAFGLIFLVLLVVLGTITGTAAMAVTYAFAAAGILLGILALAFLFFTISGFITQIIAYKKKDARVGFWVNLITFLMVSLGGLILTLASQQNSP